MKLTEVLHEQLIKFPLTGTTKTEVIEELLGKLSEAGAIGDREAVLAAVLERENIMTTGVGNGVAIPHCKSADAEDFAVAMGVHPGGIDFQSLDQKPAYVIFLLVGPENQPGVHIRLLSRISRVISNEAVREKILDSDSAASMLQLLKDEEDSSFKSD